MKLLIKIISSVLILSAILASVISCNDKPTYEEVTYSENGLTLKLRSNMRRSYVEGYDFYFSNLAIVLTATKFDAEFLTSQGVSADIDAQGYTEEYIKRRELDKEMIYYLAEPEYNRYSFRYTYVQDGSELFLYIVIIGGPGNLWYVEVCCDQEDSEIYLPEFETWRKNIKES
ncbi:MAG: hypothetical protein E7617_07590 [Ruminococcaceae bacterium]|nr:hypothetical protein [Oscillospiraceae bacterium]